MLLLCLVFFFVLSLSSLSVFLSYVFCVRLPQGTKKETRDPTISISRAKSLPFLSPIFLSRKLRSNRSGLPFSSVSTQSRCNPLFLMAKAERTKIPQVLSHSALKNLSHRSLSQPDLSNPLTDSINRSDDPSPYPVQIRTWIQRVRGTPWVCFDHVVNTLVILRLFNSCGLKWFPKTIRSHVNTTHVMILLYLYGWL